MKFDLREAILVLERTPAVLQTMLADLPDHWVRANYGENTFSPFDVVGHLTHADRYAFVPRLRHMLSSGASVPFEPFNRYGMYETDKQKSVAEVLHEFQHTRGASLQALRDVNLTPRHLQLQGQHPDLGPVTVENLLAAWIAHDLNHIAQICKALSCQYTDEVGPWRVNLSILG